MRIKLRPFLLLLVVIGTAGCSMSGPRIKFETRTLEGVVYSRAFDETELAISRHFDLRYSDRDHGIISTRYSSEKSIEGIVKIRAIASVEERPYGGGTVVHIKVIRERFVDKWEFDHDLSTQIILEGYDYRLANAILDEIQESAAR